MFDGKKGFSQRDLEFLAIFANHISIAMQNQYLLEEVRKAGSFRKNYEQHLDDLMGQLQDSPPRNAGASMTTSRSFSPVSKTTGASRFGRRRRKPNGKWVHSAGGRNDLRGSSGLDRKGPGGNRGRAVRGAGDLSRAPIFIPTANPRDLGEQFLLKIYLAEGQQLDLPCKVIFSNKYGKESHNLRRGMGIKFLDLPPELESRWEIILNLFHFHQTRRSKTLPNPLKVNGGGFIPSF